MSDDLGETLAQRLGEPPFCHLGYPATQLMRLLGDRWPRFVEWGFGITTVVCDGQGWNPLKQAYERTACVVPHGTVVYLVDVTKFLDTTRR